MTQQTLKVNNRASEAKIVFPDKQSYEHFRQGYRSRVLPALENYRKAHKASQENAKKHCVS
jgi:hypothetical protein